MENKTEYLTYARAKKQVEAIKGFYGHLTAYLMFNIGLLLVKSNILTFFIANGTKDANVLDWVHWNLIVTPLLWGVGLLIHGLYVFKFKSIPLKDLKPKILKDWEEKQIQKYIEEENHEF